MHNLTRSDSIRSALRETGGRVRGRLACAVAVAAIVVGAVACQKADSGASAETAASSASANPAPSAATALKPAAPAVPDAVRKHFGRWMRADGGYVLEVRNADVSGVLEAAYFNPKSIHVSRAIWMQGDAGFKIVVELNDVGYPGATYVLSHDPQTDRLVGTYTQPAMQQSFDIEFVRQPR